MSALSFKSAQAVRFDLPHGAVRAASGDDRFVLVPTAALVELARAAPAEAVATLGREIGAGVGRRAAARIRETRASTLEEFITQLAGEAALAGVGVWSIERWGRALVVVVSEGPAGGPMLAAIVGSAVEAASGRTVGSALLSSEDGVARVLIASDRAVDRVSQWIGSGVSWGDAIARLHGEGS